MAKNNNKILLGYEDDSITEKHKGQVNYTVNKIGGEPDFPSDSTKIDNLNCDLCELPSRLVVQIYAPLDTSTYHRTLYVFACINPNCWSQNESWKCFRIQKEESAPLETEENNACALKFTTIDWCSDADDWGDEDNNANLVEENCNIINNMNEKSDDEEESSSFEDSVRMGFGTLSIDDKNANNGTLGGAVGRLHSPMATAEIEGNEGEVITVETPTVPKTNLTALLSEYTPLPRVTTGTPNNIPFVSHFMSVWEEEEGSSYNLKVDHHVKELLTEYQQKNVDFLPDKRGEDSKKTDASVEDKIDMAVEEYEKSKPAHGDLMFHHFISKIQANPGHILRYNREGMPLLLYPLQEPLKRCNNCQGELVFEFQIMPTIISKLRLTCDSKQCSRLEFGTVLIYTCKKSCWSTNDYFKEEVVVLQRENY